MPFAHATSAIVLAPPWIASVGASGPKNPNWRWLLNAYDTTMEIPSTARTISGTKRLSFNLTIGAFEELKRISQELGTSMKDVLRLALGLVRIAVDEAKRGNKLVIVSQVGEQLREIVLPH